MSHEDFKHKSSECPKSKSNPYLLVELRLVRRSGVGAVPFVHKQIRYTCRHIIQCKEYTHRHKYTVVASGGARVCIAAVYLVPH